MLGGFVFAFVCCIVCLGFYFCFETEFLDICRNLEKSALLLREVVFIKQRCHLLPTKHALPFGITCNVEKMYSCIYVG